MEFNGISDQNFDILMTKSSQNIELISVNFGRVFVEKKLHTNCWAIFSRKKCYQRQKKSLPNGEISPNLGPML
jgi:hypothetical protein